MIDRLKRADRILLEMHTGMILYGLVCSIPFLIFAGNRLNVLASLWFGILLAVFASIHMGWVLKRALACPERAAKMITAGYFFRYAIAVLVMVLVAVTAVYNYIVVFVGYMSLKVSAYLQPFTHRCYLKLFNEKDPVAQPLAEDEEISAQEQ